MGLAKLTFGTTNLIGDGVVSSGAENLPDPESVEFGDPGSIRDESPADSDDGGRVSLDLASSAGKGDAGDESFDFPTDRTTVKDIAGKAKKPAAPEGDVFASAPEDESDAAEPAGTAGEQQAVEGFTAEMVELAKEYGWDEAAVKRFGSPENLEWAMIDADRRAAEFGKQKFEFEQKAQQPQQLAPQQQQVAAQPPAAPVQQQPQQPQSLPGFTKYTLDKKALADKGFDDDSYEVIAGIAEHFNAQIDQAAQILGAMLPVVVAQQQRFEQVTGQSQAEEETQFARDMDEYIVSLGPEWEQVYGKGDYTTLRQGSPEWEARAALGSAVKGLKHSDAKPYRGAANSKLAQLANRSLHFEKAQELDRKSIATKVSQRRSQAIPRPGGQRAQPMTGEERAFRRVAAFDKKVHGAELEYA